MKCLGLKQGLPQYAMIERRKHLLGLVVYLLGLVVYLLVFNLASYAGCEGFVLLIHQKWANGALMIELE